VGFRILWTDSKKTSWIVGSLLFIISCIPKLTHDIGSDSAIYLYFAEQLLSGKKYYYDFVEPNSPIAFFVYTVPVMIGRWLSISPLILTVFYILIISYLSILLCSVLLLKSDTFQNTARYNALMVALFYAFSFPMPILLMNDIATKSIIFIACITPYLLSYILEIENKKLKLPLKILLGLLAGLAVSLKPQYVAFLAIMEIYLMIKKRNLWVWVRLPSIIAAGFVLLYGMVLVFYMPEYLFKNIPLQMVFYVGKISTFNDFVEKIITILTYLSPVLIVCVILFNTIKNIAYSDLLLAIIGTSTALLLIEGLISKDQLSVLYFFLSMTFIYFILTVITDHDYMARLMKKHVSIALLTLLFCILTITTANDIITVFNFQKRNLEVVTNTLEAYVNRYARTDSILVFSDNGAYNFPLLNDTGKSLYQRLPVQHVVWGLEQFQENEEHFTASQRKSAEVGDAYIHSALMEAFTNHPPKIVFSDEHPRDALYLNVCFGSILTYFLGKYPDFNKIWNEDYQLIDVIDLADVFPQQKEHPIYITIDKQKKQLEIIPEKSVARIKVYLRKD